MSKIGKKPIQIPKDVKVEIGSDEVKISGPKGSLVQKIPTGIGVHEKDGLLHVSLKKESVLLGKIYGTTRAILSNMVSGVTTGWTKQLEIVGTGYRAEVQGNTLVLTLGFSHPVKIVAPEGITFEVVKSAVTVSGRDKHLVGKIAAEIRSIKPPEPYKGKGIKYVDEVIRRKVGKAAKAIGGTSVQS